MKIKTTIDCNTPEQAQQFFLMLAEWAANLKPVKGSSILSDDNISGSVIATATGYREAAGDVLG